MPVLRQFQSNEILSKPTNSSGMVKNKCYDCFNDKDNELSDPIENAKATPKGIENETPIGCS